ncbi:hypothetical protein DKX38_020670 [Salix brachista]|uniref:Uncharacterized protein n=1 Tax=Salix brachista TaxID=2182728 RepID=A0A5N5KBG0_9ROSI|nr:hypothetical protein DKX38_020670 [Salix brachista]
MSNSIKHSFIRQKEQKLPTTFEGSATERCKNQTGNVKTLKRGLHKIMKGEDGSELGDMGLGRMIGHGDIPWNHKEKSWNLLAKAN